MYYISKRKNQLTNIIVQIPIWWDFSDKNSSQTIDSWNYRIFGVLELLQIQAGQFYIGVLRVCAASTRLV